MNKEIFLAGVLLVAVLLSGCASSDALNAVGSVNQQNVSDNGSNPQVQAGNSVSGEQDIVPPGDVLDGQEISPQEADGLDIADPDMGINESDLGNPEDLLQ